MFAVFQKTTTKIRYCALQSLKKHPIWEPLGSLFWYFFAFVVVPFPELCQGCPLGGFRVSPVTFLGVLGIPWARKAAQSDTQMCRKSMFWPLGFTSAAQLSTKGSLDVFFGAPRSRFACSCLAFACPCYLLLVLAGSCLLCLLLLTLVCFACFCSLPLAVAWFFLLLLTLASLLLCFCLGLASCALLDFALSLVALACSCLLLLLLLLVLVCLLLLACSCLLGCSCLLLVAHVL